MPIATWHPGFVPSSPVYLDANILVGYFVSSHRLYPQSARIVGDIFINQQQVLVSLIGSQEALWAMASISFGEIVHHSNPKLSQKAYKKWYSQIFQRFGPRFYAIGSMLRDWVKVGINVDVVPKTQAEFDRALQLTPTYMQTFGLAPDDALHLALAENHASTFITGDSDFKNVSTSKIAIIHVP